MDLREPKRISISLVWKAASDMLLSFLGICHSPYGKITFSGNCSEIAQISILFFCKLWELGKITRSKNVNTCSIDILLEYENI